MLSYIPDHFGDCLLVGLDFGYWFAFTEKNQTSSVCFLFFICVRVRVARMAK